jgi:hypothetical protein
MDKYASAWQELEKWVGTLDVHSSENKDAIGHLADWINLAIQSDFNRLIQWLYRVDVNEDLLKKTLRENPETDAGLLIAQLAFERMVEKKQSRKNFGDQTSELL